MGGVVDVSVVIGFRNWGIQRLELAVQSIQESFGRYKGEVIVSDYGSAETDDSRQAMENLGAIYVYTPTNDEWSRSRALNAGYAVSKGNVLISTDADMIFSPESMEIITGLALKDPKLCLLLQCRDLPTKWSDNEVRGSGFLWSEFEADARIRPRWGMGGMMAVPRQVFERIRGLDERMHTYGGEDIDFATRAKRAGQRLLWVDDPRVRMYHMWHPPTRLELEKTGTAGEAIAFNKKIVYEDKTFVRNTLKWEYPLAGARPLVTVAIATHNRATYLKDAINSVLAQTMQDFEILVIDDGSTDETRSVVEGFDDLRVKYIHQDQRGISAARNHAADLSKGHYTAVLDDDDLMTPWRLEKHFEHIHAGSHGSFGSFVNFDNVTGEMHLFASKKVNAGTILETGGAPGHGTWLIETEILRTFRYDESLSSGVDNNIALRMIRSGVVLHHSGEIMLMRRMHPGQVTITDEQVQKTSAHQTRQLFTYTVTNWGKGKLSAERGKGDYVPIRFGKELDRLKAFLPDHLVERTLRITDSTKSVATLDLENIVKEFDPAGVLTNIYGQKNHASLEDITAWKSSGLSFEIIVNENTDQIRPDNIDSHPSLSPTASSTQWMFDLAAAQSLANRFIGLGQSTHNTVTASIRSQDFNPDEGTSAQLCASSRHVLECRGEKRSIDFVEINLMDEGDRFELLQELPRVEYVTEMNFSDFIDQISNFVNQRQERP